MKILVVGPSWVGDAVMAQSLYKIISRNGEQIEVLSPTWSEGILSRMSEVRDTIISPFKHGEFSLRKRKSLGVSLQNRGYDQAIILTNSLKSSLVPFFANIPQRTGWLGEFRYGLINDVRYFNKNTNSLMIEQFSVLGPKGEIFKNEDIPYPRLNIDLINLEKLKNKFKIQDKEPIIALCPGAEFGPAKRWPVSYYSVIAEEYLSQGWTVIILGSERDALIAKEIEASVSLECNLYNLAGKTSLVDAVDILSFANIVLTNDSGLMHIAAAVETPLVALYGPTSPNFTPPLNIKARVIKKTSGFSKKRTGKMENGYDFGLYDIKPQEVLFELESLRDTLDD